MKKLFLYVFPVLIFYELALAQSLLPECEGNNKNILEFSTKHFSKVRKWTDCQGTTVSPKGDRYVGEFHKGKFHGQGVFIGANGRKYMGEYKNHKKHGQGTYIYANGDKYVGEWKKAKFFGQGTYIYANGDKYVGEFMNGKRHGAGIFEHANKKIERGIWKKDKLIKPKK